MSINKNKNTALITGITGQDGAYLAEFLLNKDYEVHGIKRRSSIINTNRVDHLYENPQLENKKFSMQYGDLTDATNLIRIIQNVKPTEIYKTGVCLPSFSCFFFAYILTKIIDIIAAIIE